VASPGLEPALSAVRCLGLLVENGNGHAKNNARPEEGGRREVSHGRCYMVALRGALFPDLIPAALAGTVGRAM